LARTIAKLKIKKRRAMNARIRREVAKCEREARKEAMARNKVLKEAAKLQKLAEAQEKLRRAKLERMDAEERLHYLKNKDLIKRKEAVAKATKEMAKATKTLGKLLLKGSRRLSRWSSERWYIREVKGKARR